MINTAKRVNINPEQLKILVNLYLILDQKKPISTNKPEKKKFPR